MRDSARNLVFVAGILVGAAVLFALLFSDDLAAERGACAERGGQIEIVSNAQGTGLVHECVLPGGSRERL